MMETSKRLFRKKGNHQLDRPLKMGLPQPCIAPSAWPLPRHGDPAVGCCQGPGSHPDWQMLREGPRPSFHEDLPAEGGDTKALWQLRGGGPTALGPRLQVVTGPSVFPSSLSSLFRAECEVTAGSASDCSANDSHNQILINNNVIVTILETYSMLYVGHFLYPLYTYIH